MNKFILLLSIIGCTLTGCGKIDPFSYTETSPSNYEILLQHYKERPEHRTYIKNMFEDNFVSMTEMNNYFRWLDSQAVVKARNDLGRVINED